MAKNTAVEVVETVVENAQDTASEVAHIVGKSPLFTTKNLIVAGAALVLTAGAVVAYRRFRNTTVVVVDENTEV